MSRESEDRWQQRAIRFALAQAGGRGLEAATPLDSAAPAAKRQCTVSLALANDTVQSTLKDWLIHTKGISLGCHTESTLKEQKK